MRKITEQAVKAFMAGRDWRSGNTAVNVQCNGIVRMSLHGNTIALRDIDTGEIEVTLANWPTPTTKERLNGICNAVGSGGFYQRNYQQYFADGQAIDSDQWVTVRAAN